MCYGKWKFAIPKNEEEEVEETEQKLSINMIRKLHPSVHWRRLSLEQAVSSLEDDAVPQPSVEDLACILQKCGKERDRGYAIRLYTHLRQAGLETHPLIGNLIVPMLVDVGSLNYAQKTFNKLPQRTEGSWNALISGYVKNANCQQALFLYQRMQADCAITPSGQTYVVILKACTKLKDLEKGAKVHEQVATKGFLHGNIVVGNALIHMYAKCGVLENAHKVFSELPIRDVVSWNALIAGCMEHGHAEEAVHLFEQMQCEGVSPSARTFVSTLKACGSLRDMEKVQVIHMDIERKGILQENLLVGTTLLDVYAKCGLLVNAQHVFDSLLVQDAVSWTALIAGYSEYGQGEEAVDCYEKMQRRGILPDSVVFLSSLKACGYIGAIDKAVDIHAEIERKGLLERDALVGTTLVDMYGKCGLLAKAQQVFDRLQTRDVVSCNALMMGYAQIGQSENVSYVFGEMLEDGIKPDTVSFIVVLSACSRRGLFGKSASFFEAMAKSHGIIPSHDHHACVVDLYGRTGQLDKAIAALRKMPVRPSLVVWHTVLGACRSWGNVDFAKQAFEHAMQLDQKDGSAYSFMSQICASADLDEEIASLCKETKNV